MLIQPLVLLVTKFHNRHIKVYVQLRKYLPKVKLIYYRFTTRLLVRKIVAKPTDRIQHSYQKMIICAK